MRAAAILLMVGWGLLACGCASTERVHAPDDEVVVSFDWRDIDRLVQTAVTSLLQSPRVQGTATPRLVVGRVVNDTCQHLDPALITERLAAALMEQGRWEIVATSAESDPDLGGAHPRSRRTPDYVLSGKLSQRNVRRDNGGLRVEYFWMLRLTRLSDGVMIWQSSDQTVKAVADGMPVW